MICRSDVHHALRHPGAVGPPLDLQGGIGRALWLDGRLVADPVDRLAPGPASEMLSPNFHLEPAEEHLFHRHMIDERVQPIDQKKGIARRCAFDDNSRDWFHQRRVRHDSGQGSRSFFESRLSGRTQAANAHIGIMGEELSPPPDESPF